MGARTDFVRALLFGVVTGVAITTAFFQLRGSSVPDRDAERDALVERARPALDACGQGVTPRVVLHFDLLVDVQGKITEIDHPSGQKPATCAESALRQAARFAAAPMPTAVPLTVLVGNPP